MKAIIQQKDLLHAIRQSSGVVEKRGTIPILANVKITTGGGTLSFQATDMDVEIGQIVNANIEVQGVTTVDAQTLASVAAKLSDGEVILELTGDTLIVKSGRSRFKLATLSADDFPVMSQAEHVNKFKMAAKDLITLIDKVKYAASNEETRHYLNGIYMHISDDKIKGVATDGHRLSIQSGGVPEGAEGLEGAIIPNKAVSIIRKALDGQIHDVTIGLSPNKIDISLDDCFIASKLVHGTFPEYERIIPSDNDKHAVVNVQDVKGALERVSVVSDNKTNSVTLLFSSGSLEVSTRSGNGSSATEVVDCNSDFDLSISFNVKYLLDAINNVSSLSCSLSLKDDKSPTIIKGEGADDELFIVSPSRVK